MTAPVRGPRGPKQAPGKNQTAPGDGFRLTATSSRLPPLTVDNGRSSGSGGDAAGCPELGLYVPGSLCPRCAISLALHLDDHDTNGLFSTPFIQERKLKRREAGSLAPGPPARGAQSRTQTLPEVLTPPGPPTGAVPLPPSWRSDTPEAPWAGWCSGQEPGSGAGSPAAWCPPAPPLRGHANPPFPVMPEAEDGVTARV